MATLHHADGNFDSSETKCGMNVGQIHMETSDEVTTVPVAEYGTKENLRGDTPCLDCVEALEDES